MMRGAETTSFPGPKRAGDWTMITIEYCTV